MGDSARSPRIGPDGETAAPEVDRVLVGEFKEGADYRTRRSRGTTDWLLVLTVAGSGEFTSTTGTQVIATPDTVTLLPPGVPHDYRTHCDHWHLLWAHFHPGREWRELLDWPTAAPDVRQLSLPSGVSARIADRLREAMNSAAGLHRHAERLAARALESALLWCDSQLEQNPRDARVSQAAEYVESHLGELLDVATLSREVGLSPSRLTHLFTEQWGVGPQRFIEQRRMIMAQRLLELTSRPISAISGQVGYSDPLYFSTRFRRHTGLSPTEFRERRELHR